MREKGLKHLFPFIDVSRCINCGRCVNVCPVNNPPERYLPISVYASRAKCAQEYATSTSGGLASLAAKKVLLDGGIVYGCAYMPNGVVQHIRVSEISRYNLLKGSKYVQSSIGDTYLNVKKDLAQNNRVLFIGTPCQIAGLKNFLGGKTENLILADIICHGVPSLGYLRSYVKSRIGTQKYDRVVFRNGNEKIIKVLSGNDIIFSSSYDKVTNKDEYISSFMDGATIRPSCHKCKYSSIKRVSDITFGDFWGLKTSLPFDNALGTSCVIINSGKGSSLFHSISEYVYVSERSLEEAVNGNDRLREPLSYSSRIRVFIPISRVLGISLSYKLVNLDRLLYLRLRSVARFLKKILVWQK